jgi:pimeloyl-ACP methyl ester carboxylesterase
MKTIFRASKLSAVATVKSRDVLVIGISFHPKPRPGFGHLSQLDRKHNFDFSIVDIACTMSFPYPHQEVRDVVAAVGKFAKSFRRVITFGGSLGGFVALNFAAQFGAEAAITLSPQFSLNPKTMPSETRWSEHRGGVTEFPFDDVAGGVAPLRELYVLYDPRNPDMEHVRSIERVARNVVHLPVPFGGHPVTSVLLQGNTLDRVLRDVAAGNLNPADVRQSLRDSRRGSPSYLRNLAIALPLRRDALRIRLLEMAHKLDQSSDTLLKMVAPMVRLRRTNDYVAIMRTLADKEAEKVARIKQLERENAQLQQQILELKQQVADLATFGE